jgi:DNA-binding XRE family transcriptional regulator
MLYLLAVACCGIFKTNKCVFALKRYCVKTLLLGWYPDFSGSLKLRIPRSRDMSSKLTEKIRQIREAETSGRAEFSQLIGIPKKTLENIELTGRAPKGEMLEAICQQWPKYTLWLMTGQTDEACGQISPDIERARSTLKKTGTDTD